MFPIRSEFVKTYLFRRKVRDLMSRTAVDWLRPLVTDTHCGRPTFRTSSAKRGSERMGSSRKSVFKFSKFSSRS